MNLPITFVERTKEILCAEFPSFEASLSENPPISIRLNKFKTTNQLPYEKVPWCESGYYLAERPSFTFDPHFHAGLYYVQEASSMFLEQAVNQWIQNPQCVLDLCAAPGGKSTHLRSILPDDCLLVSNEIIRSRSHILAENLMKWGHSSCIVTHNTAEEIGQMTHLFDAIIVDAPCSGEGMFRKDPASMNEWSVQNIINCASRQQNIIDDIWNALRPGGILIYSTCTYNLDENEQNIVHFASKYEAEVLNISTNKVWNIASGLDGKLPVYRFLPHKIKGEGFFLAVLRKPEDETVRHLKAKKSKSNKEAVKTPNIVKTWLMNSENFEFDVENNRIFAFPKDFVSQLSIINSYCYIVHKGILLGEIKGKDVIPHQSLALSCNLNREQTKSAEVDFDTAISFLKCEALLLGDDSPTGYLLITYQNIPLGWVKNLGSRANNLYPHEWRIRSSYLPEDIKTFWLK
ncbi:MAG: rRNA cytosine-C5-methyltransferase [Bacteroidales bacterium]